MKLTKNFSLSEFKSKDGASTPFEVLKNIQRLAEQLQVIRNEIKKPIHVNSGYRSPRHNKNIGGSENSQHILGRASDIYVKNMNVKDLHKTILKLIKERKILQGGVGLYLDKNFVHYDIRGYKARW